MSIHLLKWTLNVSILQGSTQIGKQLKERQTIIQKETVQTYLAIDFRGTLLAIFYLRT
jgi:hypothetical protein